MPLLSIIMVCRNPGPRVREALDSIWTQREGAAEIVVIDGASTDGTREWLEENRGRLGFLRSEPDRGIYDAMNKGIAAAQGEWVLFLGTDDRLAGPDVLATVADAVHRCSAGVLVGEAAFDDGRVYGLAPNDRAVRRNFVHHQAAFYQASLFAEHGLFDASLALMADYDFNLRLRERGVRFDAFPRRVAVCASRGQSDRGRWLGYREEIGVRHRHFPAWRCWPWDAGSVIRYLRKRLLTVLPHG